MHGWEYALLLVALLVGLRLMAAMSQYLKGLGAPRILTNFLFMALQLGQLNVKWPPIVKEFLQFLKRLYIDMNWV